MREQKNLQGTNSSATSSSVLYATHATSITVCCQHKKAGQYSPQYWEEGRAVEYQNPLLKSVTEALCA